MVLILIGNCFWPMVMAGLLYLGIRQWLKAERKPPLWMLATVSIGMLVSLTIAVRTGTSIAATVASWFSR